MGQVPYTIKEATMLKLNEKQKIREYDLQLKSDNVNLNHLLPIVNDMILNKAYCILTYHSNVALLRIKIYENSSEFSDLKISCKLENCEKINSMLTSGNAVMSMKGILQFYINDYHVLHIDMYNPEDSVLSNRLTQIINAIK